MGTFLVSAQSYGLLKEFIKRELTAENKESLFGVTWQLITPLFTVLVLWFVFSFGFKKGGVGSDGTPFLVGFLPAYAVWLFISSTLAKSSRGLRSYAYILTKVKIDPLLPITAKIVFGLLVHVAILPIVLLFLTPKVGFTPWELANIFQLFYYCLYTLTVISSLSLCISLVSLVVKDVLNITDLVLQFAFWLTPIFWDPSLLTGWKRLILYLNPFYYAIEGYRDAIYRDIMFYTKVNYLLYWGYPLTLSLIAFFLLKRLKTKIPELL